ncbi:hypothetical protein ACFQGT_00915 [Natrialbaceae archaeon GCM10025810]
MSSTGSNPDSSRRLSEKELFLLLLVGIAVAMALTGVVLVVY